MSARAIVAALATYCLLLACSTTEMSGGNGKNATPTPTPAATPATASATTPVDTDTSRDDDSQKDDDESDKSDDDASDDKPEKAITVGSFTVWTVPSDPAPLQDYYVYIQVKLPSSIDAITQEDLSGRLVGTDTYVQEIGRNASGGFDQWAQQFKAKGNKAVLRMIVPGSFEAVKDTIEVRSDALDEEQTISIVF